MTVSRNGSGMGKALVWLLGFPPDARAKAVPGGRGHTQDTEVASSVAGTSLPCPQLQAGRRPRNAMSIILSDAYNNSSDFSAFS